MRALVLAVLASVASAKDPPPQCEGFGSCLMTGKIGRAVAHGVKDAADELRKGDILSKAVAGVIDTAKKDPPQARRLILLASFQGARGKRGRSF